MACRPILGACEQRFPWRITSVTFTPTLISKTPCVVVDLHGALMMATVARVGMKISIYVHITGRRASAKVVDVDPDQPDIAESGWQNRRIFGVSPSCRPTGTKVRQRDVYSAVRTQNRVASMNAQNPSTSMGERRRCPLPSRTHPQKQNLVIYTDELTHLGKMNFSNFEETAHAPIRNSHACESVRSNNQTYP